MSKHQQVQAIRVANVPADVFERQVESDNPHMAQAVKGYARKTAHYRKN